MFSTEQVLLEHTEITSIVRCRSITGGLDGKQCSPAWSIYYDEFMTNILQVHRCTLNMFQLNTLRQWILTIWLELGSYHLQMNEMSILNK